MNTLDAAHQLARDYPGGVEALAPRLGYSAHTLRHQLTRQGAAKLAGTDMELMTQFALEVGMDNPLRILTSFAENCRAIVFMLPPEATVDVDDTLKGLAEAARAFSDFVGTVATAIADAKVTANELKEIDRRLSALVGHGQAVQARLAAIHQAGRSDDLAPSQRS